MTRLITAIVLVLGLLHHDFWWWDDPTLVFGFLPIGLAYHAAYSVACGVVWWWVVTRAWPDELEAFAKGGEPG